MKKIIKQIKFYFNLIVFNRIKTYIVLEKAKERIENGDNRFCCYSICNVLIVYLSYVKINNINKLIPKFNSKYLTGEEKSSNNYWWDENDKESRIKALDRLVKEYKESGEYIYYKDILELDNND